MGEDCRGGGLCCFWKGNPDSFGGWGGGERLKGMMERRYYEAKVGNLLPTIVVFFWAVSRLRIWGVDQKAKSLSLVDFLILESGWEAISGKDRSSPGMGEMGPLVGPRI